MIDIANQYVPIKGKSILKLTLWKVDEEVGIEANWLTIEILTDVRCFNLPDHRLIKKKRYLSCSCEILMLLLAFEMGQESKSNTITLSHVGVSLPKLCLELNLYMV
ncbi:hypothetical protein CR513_33200, partial [Mucuna pruriens]